MVRTAGKEMEGEGLLYTIDRGDNGVPSIISSGTTGAYIGLAGKHVYELSLALVTPLGAENDGYCIDQRKSSVSSASRPLLRTAHAGTNSRRGELLPANRQKW